jgi:hypothetical protein
MSAPSQQHCNTMALKMMFVVFQPNESRRNLINGANVKLPTPSSSSIIFVKVSIRNQQAAGHVPEPAVVMPVAMPLFLLKYKVTPQIACIYVESIGFIFH